MWKMEEFMKEHNRQKAEQEKIEQHKLTEHQAMIDRKLEQPKQRIKHEWLAAHPGHSEKDFESLAWPHLKINLMADMRLE
jgi:hypothetical protein